MKSVHAIVERMERQKRSAPERKHLLEENKVDVFSRSLSSDGVCVPHAAFPRSVDHLPVNMVRQQARTRESSIGAKTMPAPVRDIELWAHRSKIQEVVPGLCITNFFGARNLGVLKANKTTHVLVCANELPIQFPNEFLYLKLNDLTDNTTTSLHEHLARSLPWIHDALKNDGRVVLHCAAGSSRSGAILIGYLMWSKKMPLDAALAIALHARPIIALNPGFIDQLREFALTTLP